MPCILEIDILYTQFISSLLLERYDTAASYLLLFIFHCIPAHTINVYVIEILEFQGHNSNK